jgi:TonB-dependent starch-binding outer membrane protein SusC
MCQPLSLKGKITDQQARAIEGATIRVLRTGFQTSSDNNGNFLIANITYTDTLLVSAIGFADHYEILDPTIRNEVLITMKRQAAMLDDVIIMAYGTTTRRTTTSNIATMRAADISRQPVTNPLSTLEGRISGLTVVQAAGLPGSAVKLQLRGQNSITQGSEPLFIIDGVPFAPNNNAVNRLNSMLTVNGAGGLSPFSFLDPNDIESIEILKDADATAIYGSRGANGVVLITTKKEKGTATRVNAAYAQGWSAVAQLPTLLNTQQYRAMRKEAFLNDGTTPTVTNAPDLLAWDSTRYTNFPELLMGGTAGVQEAIASISGGSTVTGYMLSATHRKETSVLPGDMSDKRTTVSAHMDHNAFNDKLRLNLSTTFSSETNTLAASGLAGMILLPPNAPPLYTAAGQLNWEENGAAFSNPLGFAKREYTAATDNLLSSLNVSFQIHPLLQLRTAVGYNSTTVEELLLTPISAQNPALTPKGAAQFSVNRFKSFIVEPQLNFSLAKGKWKYQALVGASWQNLQNNGWSIAAADHSSDALIRSLSAAPTIASRSNTEIAYKYAAAFARLTLDFSGKYLLNLSGRRDASSRFGPRNQVASFGALGAAWIFSREALLSRLTFLSFGKLKASFGETGNDQIGDYQYLDAWTSVPPYQSSSALSPTNLYNPDYGWERTRKLEFGLDLGFAADRLLINIAWYRNRSSNQLVQYALPSQTGFNSLTANLPALVQNTGWELEFTSRNVSTKKMAWTTTLNLSIPRNKLLDFPGIESSSYANTYAIGEPLSLVKRLKLVGVDTATGIYTFYDRDQNGSIQIPADYVISGYNGPRWFGGFGNTITLGGFELHAFFVFKNQWGSNFQNSLLPAGFIPGTMNNQPVEVLQRWRKPGDITAIQKFTTTTSAPAYAAVTRMRSSNGVFTDASFARLKTLAISYSLPDKWIRNIKMRSVRIAAQAQNLITWTSYKVADPENQNLLTVPPLRSFLVSLHIGL